MNDEAGNVWDDVPDWGGVGARRLVRDPGGSLNASVWELQPGASQFVYHFHHGSQALVVLRRLCGTMHDGERTLRRGRAVPAWEGDHQCETPAVAGDCDRLHRAHRRARTAPAMRP